MNRSAYGSTLRWRPMLGATVLLLVISACGSSDSDAATTTSLPTTAAAPTTTTAAAPITTSTVTTTTTATATTTTTAAPTTTTRPITAFERAGVAVAMAMEPAATGSLGTFTASGLAVDDGYMCPEGTCYDLDLGVMLVCEDGSDRLKLDTADEGEGAWVEGHWVTTGNWLVLEGQGFLAGMDGEGKFSTDFYGTEDLREYVGEVWRDQ